VTHSPQQGGTQFFSNQKFLAKCQKLKLQGTQRGHLQTTYSAYLTLKGLVANCYNSLMPLGKYDIGTSACPHNQLIKRRTPQHRNNTIWGPTKAHSGI
jgi:hypothetical protein